MVSIPLEERCGEPGRFLDMKLSSHIRRLLSSDELYEPIGLWFLPAYFTAFYGAAEFFRLHYFSLPGRLMACELFAWFVLGVYVLVRYALLYDRGVRLAWLPAPRVNRRKLRSLLSAVSLAIYRNAAAEWRSRYGRKKVKIRIALRDVSRRVRDVRSRQYTEA
ncbi:MAG: hypothetical protein KGJ33_00655 [Patescibacteria group bacterium]|nr:hypothetical protein [Patescibacteria group bacterium]